MLEFLDLYRHSDASLSLTMQLFHALQNSRLFRRHTITSAFDSLWFTETQRHRVLSLLSACLRHIGSKPFTYSIPIRMLFATFRQIYMLLAVDAIIMLHFTASLRYHRNLYATVSRHFIRIDTATHILYFSCFLDAGRHILSRTLIFAASIFLYRASFSFRLATEPPPSCREKERSSFISAAENRYS